MKSLTKFAFLCALVCLLAGCETTTQEPDINSLKPTQQEQNQQAIQQSLQS